MSLLPVKSLAQDVLFSFRRFRRRPVETTLAVAALAIGIGLSTAMFSILWGTVLRGLPFEDADRLVRVETISRGERMTPTDADFLTWRHSKGTFDGMAAWLGSSFNLSGTGLEAHRCNGAFISANLFRLAGVRPLVGRDFDDRDEAPNAPLVAILSAELWEGHFNSDPNILGRPIKLNGRPGQVIGVMPEGFGFPLHQEIWLPLQLDPKPTPNGQASRVQVLGKLKTAASQRRAEAELQAIPASPKGSSANGVHVTPFVRAYTEDLQSSLYLLFGGSLGLLLVVCANVSGLLAAQTVARLPELAVRSAVGATRTRLLVQMLAETTLLALLGAVFSLPLAMAAIRVYMVSQGNELPSFWMDVRLDGPSIAYALAVTIVVSLLSTVIPSVQATGTRLNEVLKTSAGRDQVQPPGALSGFRLALQVALTFSLLVATGLIIVSLGHVGRLNFGHAPEKVLTAQLLVPSTYSTPEAQLRFFEELESRLVESLGPGQVAFASALPGNEADEAEVEIEGQPRQPEAQEPKVPYLIVSRAYFRLLRVPALQGRSFNTSDRSDGQPAAIVNQSFVRRYFGTSHPVGARFRFLSAYGPGPWRTIVGIVPDLVLGEASGRRPEGVYIPLEQAPGAWMAVLLHSPRDPTRVSRALRQAVAAVDHEIPVFWIRTLQETIDNTRLPLKTMAQVFLTLGTAALFLSLLGVYGVTSQTLASRSREMAIRLSLGGSRSDLLRLISYKVLVPILGGIVLGAFTIGLTSRLLAPFLFEVPTWKPAVFMIVGSVLIFGGLCACLLPGTKVLRVQPAEVLRGD